MIKASGTIISLAFILGLLSIELPGGGIWPIIFGVLGAVLFSQRGTSSQRKLQSKTEKKLQKVRKNYKKFVTQSYKKLQ